MKDGHEACFFPSPPRHFALSPTPFFLIPHAVLPYPPRRFTLSATPFCLIPHAIFALSPTPFCLIPHVVSPYPQSHLFTFSSFHLFTFSPFHLFPPPLTTANTLVLRILAPRKPIFMQQMRWCFMPIAPSRAVPFIQNNHLKISTLSNLLKKNSTRTEW